MINLLIKDFKLMFPKEGRLVSRIIKRLFSLLSTALFIAIETFLFTAILKKIDTYQNAPSAFTMLFLMVISALLIFLTTLKAKKLFFNELDISQLSPHPIENSQLILSKLVFLFLTHYVSALTFTLPIFISYGVLYHKTMLFYYLAVFYPVLTSIFEIGIALLLVYPVWMLFEFLKKHVVLEFCSAVILLLASIIPYSLVLNLFISLVANNELTLIFTEESMGALIAFQKNAIPLNLLVNAFLNGGTGNLFPYICMSLSVLILGLSITIFTFHRVRNISVSEKIKKGRELKAPVSQNLALIKKECLLLIKKPEYIFSFSGLLIVQPFLTYLIITAMNTIFQTGTFLYYTTLFPGFVPLVDVLLIMMIAIVINSGANSYIAIEERTIKNLKTMPVSYKKQILFKLLIPLVLSIFMLIISLAAICIFKVMSTVPAVFAGIVTVMFLVVFDMVSLIEEMQIRHGKPRSTFLSTLISYALPITYIVIGIVLSYIGTPLITIFAAGIALLLLVGLPVALILFKNMGRWFMELEAIN